MNAISLVFLGANTPWVYALASAFASNGHHVSAIASYDFGNFRRLRPRWPEGDPPAELRRTFWILPPGYVGTLAPIFAPLLRRWLARAILEVEKNVSPWVVICYPWFHRTVRDVPDDRLIYFNLDHYPLYKPGRAALICRQEDELVRRAALTICLSRRQVENLRARHPDRAKRIRHFPLGVAQEYLNPQPQRRPVARTVGYVGNLIDRVDWRLVCETAQAMPDVAFIFVGGLEGFGGGGARPGWKAERAAALALPNVRRVGPVRQKEVPEHYWNFSVNWIPYAIDHAFNQASCPTKIMDGLASGRPVISTDLPECRLYPEWIARIRSANEASVAIRLALEHTTADREGAQLQFARQQIWSERAKALLSWLQPQ